MSINLKNSSTTTGDTLMTGLANSTGATLTVRQNSALSDKFALKVQTKNGGGDYGSSSGFYTSDGDAMELRLATSTTNNVLISSETFTASYLKGGPTTFGRSITVGSDVQASITLQATGTTFLQMFQSSSSSFINTGTSGGTVFFGAPATNVTNVHVQGLMDADNYKIDGDQGTSGQVMTSSGSGVSWTTPTSGTVTGSGTAKNLTMWSTGGTGIEDSPIKTVTTNTLNQIVIEDGERLIIDKPSTVTQGDPAFNISQDGASKVEFGWDDDGGGFGFMYNYSGNGLKLGAAGNNPMIEVVTTSGSESVNLHKQLELKDYGSGTYTGTSAYYLIADSSGNVIEKTPAQVRSDIGAGTGDGTVTGTGTSKRVALWSGTSSISSDSTLTFQGGELGVGVTSPTRTLTVADRINIVSATNASANLLFGDTADDDIGQIKYDNSNDQMQFQVFNDIKMTMQKSLGLVFNKYTATAVATTGSLSPNQSFQAPSEDTLATLAVDPSGNVVRGEQEGTWTFTNAQLNSSLGNTLISAPGNGKLIVVTQAAFLLTYSGQGGFASSQNLEVRQNQPNFSGTNNTIVRYPSAKMNNIINSSNVPSAPNNCGLYVRDIPTGNVDDRSYDCNQATTLHKTSSVSFPSVITSIKIKLKYKIFDASTF